MPFGARRSNYSRKELLVCADLIDHYGRRLRWVSADETEGARRRAGGAIVGAVILNLLSGEAYIYPQARTLAQVLTGAYIGGTVSKQDIRRLPGVGDWTVSGGYGQLPVPEPAGGNLLLCHNRYGSADVSVLCCTRRDWRHAFGGDGHGCRRSEGIGDAVCADDLQHGLPAHHYYAH